MAHTNVQLVSGNLTTGGNDPTFFIDQVNNKVGIGEVPETSGDDSSNVLQVNGSMLATKYHGDGSSLTGLNDSKWLEYSGDASKIYYNGGFVGIGVTDPDSKLEVRGNIRASFSDTNHGMFIDAGGTILRNYGGNGAGLHFTANQIFPTNYLGSYSAGGIDLGSSAYRWNNVYTEALNASGTVTASSFSGIQASDVPSLYTEVDINSPASTSGTWVTATSSAWGDPKFNNVHDKYAYNDPPGYRQYNIPSGMKSAYISQLQWSSGGYVDAYGVQSDGGLVFLRRINTRQGVENTDEGNPDQHDGMTITLAGSGLHTFSAIRLVNKSGRFHLTGLAFVPHLEGTEGTGMVHPDQLSATLSASQIPTLNQDTTGQAGTIAGQENSATIAASTSHGASTIVQRTGDGYVFANYFNTTANDVSSGVTKVMVETGNDNYIRHGTADAIKTFLDVSVDAGNNTIVRRHSSGYIFANYFNTTPDDVSSGVTKVCVETGNDGYIRHGTSAAISSFLGLGDYAYKAGGSAISASNGTFSEETQFTGGTNTSHANYSTNRDWYIRSGENAGKVIIQDSGGNTGIGTSSPSQKLEVNGNIKLGGSGRQIYLDTGGAGLHWGQGYSRIVDDGNLRICTDDTMHFNTGSNSSSLGTERMKIEASGRTNVYNGLRVSGTEYTFNYRDSGRQEYGEHGILNNPQDQSFGLSVLAGVRAARYVAHSDERIKSNIVDIHDTTALDQLRQLQPKYYEYVDKVGKGSSTVIGFIAQEVKEVVPQAVSVANGDIPNIYETANVSANTITFTNFHTSDLDATSNTLVVYEEGTTRKDLTIVEVIDEHTIRVDTEVPGEDVFVYGQVVEDFHHLNKDYLWTIGTAALQEVDRQLQAEKARNDALEARILALENK